MVIAKEILHAIATYLDVRTGAPLLPPCYESGNTLDVAGTIQTSSRRSGHCQARTGYTEVRERPVTLSIRP